MPWSRIFNVANMFFNAIPETKILAKISEFTVDLGSKGHSLVGDPLKALCCVLE